MIKYLLLLSFLAMLNCSHQGIDVSVWQGDNINFKKVKNDGKNFVIIRAGCGSDKDKYFETNYKKAKEAGLNVGAYWYAHAMSTDASTNEAKKVLNAIDGKKFEYPIYYDIEKREILDKGKTFVSGIAKNFCSILEKKKKYCGIYASKSFLENYFTSEVLKKYTIWVAQYNSECTYKGSYGIWQKSSKGKVDGISGNVDLDVSYVDVPSVMKKKHLNGF